MDGAAAGGGEPSVRVADPPRFAALAARVVAREVGRSVASRGRCDLALAGGSTPRPVYRRLAREPGVDWPSVRVYFGDERAVPPDDPRSNFRMAREELLDRLPEGPARVSRMRAERDDLASAAEAYAATLPEPLDVLLLGIGEDGHTASLFPGSPALEEGSRRVVPSRSPDPPARRLTVTPPVIEGARSRVVLAAGERKAPAVRAAVEGEGPARDCPARLARPGTWVLDRGAARALSRSPEERSSGAGGAT